MNLKLFSFILILVLYVGFILYESTTQLQDNPELQQYIHEYEAKVKQELTRPENESAASLAYQPSSKGTSGNFEGPQVLLKAIKFHNEILNKEDERLKHFDGLSAIFDPDHPYYGLPDVKISIKDVRLYKPEQGKIANLLGFDNDPKPYQIYKKEFVSDSAGKRKHFEMQLWLTEFEVTIDVRPDLDTHHAKREEEKGSLSYPGFWYGLQKKSVNLEDLEMEFKDQRYGNLAFILEVIPDKSPIYIQTTQGKTSKADFAIAAIYCSKAQIGNEEKVQRINTNVHSGQPVFLINEFDFEKMNTNVGHNPESLPANVERVLNAENPKDAFIWNKPYYMKLHFTNLGTWRTGLVNQNKFHDQVTYSFLMPVFVVGSWDVIAPQEVLPKWDPPAPYIKKFSVTTLLPFWAKGVLGKIVGLALVILLILIGIQLILPAVGVTLKKLLFK